MNIISNKEMDDTLVKRIKSGTIIDYWANGKVGNFQDFESNCLCRFCETNNNGSHYLLNEQERRNQPILACGFVGWLIKHWGTDTTTVYSGYLQARLNQYKDSHKNDADAFRRDFDQEYYAQYRTQEEQWIKQSEAIYEFITPIETESIKEYARCYFEYVETQKKSHEPSRNFPETKVEDVDSNLKSTADIQAQINDAVDEMIKNHIIDEASRNNLINTFTSGRSNGLIQIKPKKFTAFFNVFYPLWDTGAVSRNHYQSEYDFISNNFQVNQKDISKSTISGAKNRSNWT